MKYTLLGVVMFFPLSMFGQKRDTLYKIYNVASQKEINLDKIVIDAAKANVIFFGEDHNDSVCHVAELLLSKKLAETYPSRVAISMEMFHTDLQPVLNEYLKGLISEKNFLKEGAPWPNYKDYQPIVMYAKQRKLPVIAANVAGRYSNAVTMDGLSVLQDFPKSSKMFLPPLPIDTAIGPYYEKFTETLGGHGMGMMKIYQTQNLWDASMAWAIASYLKKNPTTKILQVNGRFHSDEKLGTVAKLKIYRPRTKILTISSFSAADFNNPNWKNYANLADYIVLTNPAVTKTY